MADPVEIPEKVTPLAAGEPVPAFDVRSGNTFADRKAAREKASKAVESDDEGTENKAVSRKRTSKK
jgi:hypothetical protein